MSRENLAAAVTVALYLLVVITAIGAIRSGRRRRKAGRGAAVVTRRSRRCRCGYCRVESLLAPWRRRAWALILPGPGRAARIRYGLGRAEYAERARSGMRMDHPDWLTGELSEESEELLAGLEAATWEDR